MPKLRTIPLFLCLLSVAIPAVTMVGASPAAAGLSSTRTCKNVETGDHMRKLSFCARVWVSDAAATQSRGVVEMHTYKWVDYTGWVDSVSQTITVNSARFYANSTTYRNSFGNDVSSTTCRVNGASSSQIACSVPNTYRVAFYGTAVNGVYQSFRTCVDTVTWRDDRGDPHQVTVGDNNLPLPLCHTA
jgi:hypothetical protein